MCLISNDRFLVFVAISRQLKDIYLVSVSLLSKPLPCLFIMLLSYLEHKLGDKQNK